MPRMRRPNTASSAAACSVRNPKAALYHSGGFIEPDALWGQQTESGTDRARRRAVHANCAACRASRSRSPTSGAIASIASARSTPCSTVISKTPITACAPPISASRPSSPARSRCSTISMARRATTANSARGFSRRAARRSPRAGSSGSRNAIAARCSGKARRALRPCTRRLARDYVRRLDARGLRAAFAPTARELADPQDFRARARRRTRSWTATPDAALVCAPAPHFAQAHGRFRTGLGIRRMGSRARRMGERARIRSTG